MKLPAVSSWLARQAASLQIVCARVMVAVLWSEFHAMKLAAMPIQM
jgi:hypothetical protein